MLRGDQEVGHTSQFSPRRPLIFLIADSPPEYLALQGRAISRGEKSYFFVAVTSWPERLANYIRFLANRHRLIITDMYHLRPIEIPNLSVGTGFQAIVKAANIRGGLTLSPARRACSFEGEHACSIMTASQPNICIRTRSDKHAKVAGIHRRVCGTCQYSPRRPQVLMERD